MYIPRISELSSRDTECSDLRNSVTARGSAQCKRTSNESVDHFGDGTDCMRSVRYHTGEITVTDAEVRR